MCFSYLRNVKCYKWNHKRVYRIYTQLCLNLRIKPKRRLKRDKPEALTVPSAVNQVWSMDFMHARLYKGKAVRLLNIIDDFNREGLAIDIRHSHPSNSVIRTLENIIEYRGKPSAIRCDNGPEYISSKIVTWAKENGIELLYIQPGKPQQNAYIERYNRTVRYDWLNQYEFDSLSDMQDFSTKWLWHYNHERPNMALGGYTPMQKLYGVAA
jgi:putative transposase